MIRYCLLFLALFEFFHSIGQVYSPKLNAKINQSAHAVSLVQSFQDLGVKTPGSQEITQTHKWLVNQYMSYGYDSIRVDSFMQDGTITRNIVVTKPGLIDEYIIVCGHYDTKNGPGANDNGSGVAAILEAARLVESLPTTRGIVFINFDKEEVGFKGSNYHVFQILGGLNIDTNLYMVFNIDQIGGTNGQPGNDKITCERDEENNPSHNNALSYLITDTLASLCKLYTTLKPEISNAFLSDYIPFEQQGYVITGLYQNASDLFGHSQADTIGNMDTASFKQAVRLTIAGVIHFAQVDEYISVWKKLEQSIRVYPNPATRYVYIDLPQHAKTIELRDINGRLIQSRETTSGDTLLDLSEVEAGLYVIRIGLNGDRWIATSLVVAP